MGKWVLFLLAAMVALAVVGFVVDAARAVVAVLLVGCALALAARWVLGKRT